LGDLRLCLGRQIFTKALELDRLFTNREPIFEVVMSSRFLVIVTNRRVLTVNVADDYQVEPVSYENWEAAGVACYESGTQFILAVGRGQGNSLQNSRGLIEIYRYEIGSSSRKLQLCSSFMLPTQDRPKRLTLSPETQTLTCVTRIQNKLLVWDLDESHLPLSEPFDFVKNHYRVVRIRILMKVILSD